MTSSDVRSSAVLVSAEAPSCVAQAQTTSPSTAVAVRPTNPCVKGRMARSDVCAVCESSSFTKELCGESGRGYDYDEVRKGGEPRVRRAPRRETKNFFAKK